MRRLIVVGALLVGVVAIPAEPAAAAELSPGCAKMNDPAFDATYRSQSLVWEEFYPGEVVTVTAGPPDTVTHGAVVNLSADGGIYLQTAYPGTVRWVVPVRDPSFFGPIWAISHFIGVPAEATWEVSCDLLYSISGTVTDRHTGIAVGGICVDISPFGQPDVIVASTETPPFGLAAGSFSVFVPPGIYQVSYIDCLRWDYAAEWYGTEMIEPVDATSGDADASFALTTGAMTGLVDVRTGLWYLSAPRTDFVQSFYYGNPGDFPMTGDWNCDGVDTPGLYRQSDGFVYLRNSNSQGIADIRFFFGNPGDVPLAGDFNGDGCDTVSIYRPSESRVFIINRLGANEGGLGAAELDYYFGNPGDKSFVGDFDIDGIDTVGLHRESTGLVYFRNSHTQGNADVQYVFGDPGDRLVAGNFSGFWVETPAVFRPSDLTFYIRHTNTQGNADRSEVWDFAGAHWQPIAGVFGLSPDVPMSQSHGGPLERTPEIDKVRTLPRLGRA